MKIAICQFSNKSSEIYNKLVNISQSMMKGYCKLHNYQYIFQEISSNLKFHDMYFYKFQMLMKYIQQYDYIVWIDIDAIPINPFISIESLIDNQKKYEIYISKDIMIKIEMKWINYIHNILMQVKKDNGFINDLKILNQVLKNQNLPFLNWVQKIGCNPHGFCSGFFILKNSDISKNILKQSYSMKQLFKSFGNKDGLYDQEALSLILQMYEERIKIFDYKFHGNMIYLENELKDQFSYDQQNNFLCHMYSLSLQNRIKGFNIIKNNKFWKYYYEN